MSIQPNPDDFAQTKGPAANTILAQLGGVFNDLSGQGFNNTLPFEAVTLMALVKNGFVAGASEFFYQHMQKKGEQALKFIDPDASITPYERGAAAAKIIIHQLEGFSGQELSQDAQNLIIGMMTEGSDAFASRIQNNASLVQRAAIEAKKNGKDVPSTIVGILETLLTPVDPNDPNSAPNGININTDSVGLSPAQQAEAQEAGIYGAAFQYLNNGGGNTGLAILLDVPATELDNNRVDGPRSNEERRAFIAESIIGNDANVASGAAHSATRFGQEITMAGLTGTHKELFIAGLKKQGFEFEDEAAENRLLAFMVELVDRGASRSEFRDAVEEFIDRDSGITAPDFTVHNTAAIAPALAPTLNPHP